MSREPTPTPRTGRPDPKLTREEFERRYRIPFVDPAFDAHRDAIDQLAAVAWEAYDEGRKAPHTRPAGPGFHDPTYDLSDEWRDARDAIHAAEARQRDPATPDRILLVCASPRSEHTCPGEMSKTWRLMEAARDAATRAGAECDVLELDRLASEYGRIIHPCKACVSTAMPLCHWPCSCYPNHGLGQHHDWMNAIYPRWAEAHGVMIVTPVHWNQATSPLKLMMDRLVCADGGNSDPTSTAGKDPERAKRIELDGWDYPQHLAARAFALLVHGDSEGTQQVRHALADWLRGMGLVDAGALSQVDRYIGYYAPYATSHAALDDDEAMFEESRNAARALVERIRQLRTGQREAGDGLEQPRQK
ncbi:flavodoxin family protein [Luteimonas sp. MC1750]|uniref:flavodoxin family protein n=1 Tax=Luteimonas sp. MC1750 TaxID=2799326 RepID=UPI0018F068AC|nr:flavodoxin family protein [Luteimonas sp. MC1750]MBJ6984360.1 flavodoxin family protein [Luteimonas sp. MC1750]QQO05019.1 flavodoxin family protein [Luteimonas sp. MC1750]